MFLFSKQTIFFVIVFFCFVSYGQNVSSNNNSSPFAFPVLTADEAQKANNEATTYFVQLFAPAEADFTTAVPVSVLSLEEAKAVNLKAIRFYKWETFKEAFIYLCLGIYKNNTVSFLSLLIPLLLFSDLLSKKRRNQYKKEKKENYLSISRRVYALLAVYLLLFGVMVFVPWSVYFGNSPQFPFIFQDFVNWNLRVLTVSIIGASIVLLLIPPIVSDYLVAITAGLGLCVYVQAMFMNKYLGTMDGTEPAWSEHRVFGTINLIIWIVLVLAPVILKKVTPAFFSKTISMATGIVLFLEILAVASMVVSASQDVWVRPKDSYYPDGSKQFNLSKQKNVVVFIFDTLGSEFIEQCFETDPESKKIVKDFIWFEDARSNYHRTFPGLTHELTGAMLPAPANNYYELLEKMWHSKSAESFYKQMKNAGYDIRLYCAASKFLVGPEDYYHEYFSNIVAGNISYEINHERLHACLRQMSGYNFAPFFAKKHFFYAFDFSDGVVQKQIADLSREKKWIPKTNPDFLKKLISSGITAEEEKPVLSFYYTTGVHRPWHVDEQCNRVEYPFETPYPTTRSCFYILSEFIRRLKEANIYDNTAILVCSDHGGNETRGATLMVGGWGIFDMSFMIKPFHENKTELTIDETKVQSIDILPTLLFMAFGKDADFKDFEGFSPNDIPNDRVRKVYRFFYDKSIPAPDPDLDRLYSAGCRGVEEYIFKDKKSFKFGKTSESFVRQIPLVMTAEENKEDK